MTQNGANGLDRGELKNGAWYYIYLISDSIGCMQTACMASLRSDFPSLPIGYDVSEKIGEYFYFTKVNIALKIAQEAAGYNISTPKNNYTEPFWMLEPIEE